MQSLNNNLSLTKEQIIEQYNKGYTIVLFTSKDTVLFKLDYISGSLSDDSILNEVLNTGLYRHNQVTHGRILQ